jgi:hypothetical protein
MFMARQQGSHAPLGLQRQQAVTSILLMLSTAKSKAIAAIVIVLVCLVSFISGYSVGKTIPSVKLGEIIITGCGVSARISVLPDRPITLSVLTQRLQPLPLLVNGALVKTTSHEYYCRYSEMISTNGVGQLPLFGGESILLLHRED